MHHKVISRGVKNFISFKGLRFRYLVRYFITELRAYRKMLATSFSDKDQELFEHLNQTDDLRLSDFCE